MANQLSVSLVSADREVWSGNASMLVAKTTIGEIGLLPGHEPVLALLAEDGQIRVTTDGAKLAFDAVGGGFLSMEHNIVTVVVRDAVQVS